MRDRGGPRLHSHSTYFDQPTMPGRSPETAKSASSPEATTAGRTRESLWKRSKRTLGTTQFAFLQGKVAGEHSGMLMMMVFLCVCVCKGFFYLIPPPGLLVGMTLGFGCCTMVRPSWAGVGGFTHSHPPLTQMEWNLCLARLFRFLFGRQ